MYKNGVNSLPATRQRSQEHRALHKKVIDTCSVQRTLQELTSSYRERVRGVYGVKLTWLTLRVGECAEQPAACVRTWDEEEASMSKY